METRAGESDEDLARAAVGGSRRAFERLVDRLAGSVTRVLASRLGDVDCAEDLSQDVWVRVFRGLASWQPDRSFRAWLFGIALNVARDEGRRRTRTPVVYTDDVPERVEPLPTSEHEWRSDVDEALAAVPEPFRTALVLVDRERLEYEEAAVSLGCAVGTVKSRVCRGRRAFRDLWVNRSGAAVGSIRGVEA